MFIFLWTKQTWYEKEMENLQAHKYRIAEDREGFSIPYTLMRETYMLVTIQKLQINHKFVHRAVNQDASLRLLINQENEVKQK